MTPAPTAADGPPRADLTALMAVLRRVTGSEAVVVITESGGAPAIEAADGLLSRERAECEHWVEQHSEARFASLFAGVLRAPIVLCGQAPGAIYALRRGPDTFDNEDLLSTFATQVDLALAVGRRPRIALEANECWASLDQLLLSAHSLGDLGRALTRVVGPLFAGAQLGVMVADRQRSTLQMMSGAFAADETAIAAHRVSFFDPRSNSARVFMTRLPYLSNESLCDHSFRQQSVAAFGLKRVLTVPLGEVGVLHIGNAHEPFDLEDVVRAQALAPRIASLVELATTVCRLRRERTVEESLSQLAIAVASGEEIQDFLPPALQVLSEATEANLVAFVPDEGSPIIGRSGPFRPELERAVLDEAGTEPGMRAYVVGPLHVGDPGWAAFHVPVQLGGLRVGTLTALRARGEPFARSERESFVRAANIAALNHAAERYQQQRAELARLQERQRIADDLHDDVAQILFAAQLTLDSILDQPKIDAQVTGGIVRARGLLIRGDTAIRNVIHRLSRPAAADLAVRLASVVASVEEEFSIAIHLGIDPDTARAARAVRRPVGDALAKVAREALVNVAKHAGPCRVGIRLEVIRQRLVLTVADDGLGVPSPSSGQHGLASLRHLVREQDGALRVVHGAAGGTNVTVSFPLGRSASTRTDQTPGAALPSSPLESREDLASSVGR